MKNENHVIAIVKVIFDTYPSIVKHIMIGDGIFFRKDEQDQLDLYNKQSLYTKGKESAEEAKQCLSIPPLYFAATDPARKLTLTQRYATLVKGLLLTHNPIFLYHLTKMSFDNISVKNLDKDSGFTITLGEMFLKYSNERTPLKFFHEFESKIYNSLNYSEKKAKEDINKILKNFVY